MLVNGEVLRNVKIEKKAFAFNEMQQKIFSLNEGEIIPNSVKDLANFENHFATFSFKNHLNIFSIKECEVIDIQWFTEILQKNLGLPTDPL